MESSLSPNPTDPNVTDAHPAFAAAFFRHAANLDNLDLNSGAILSFDRRALLPQGKSECEICCLSWISCECQGGCFPQLRVFTDVF